MEYKRQLKEIIDGVRDDFSVLGAFAFTGQGDVFDINERFWRVYDAALKARAIYDAELTDQGKEDISDTPFLICQHR